MDTTMSVKPSPPPPSTEHEHVKTYEQTLEQVRRSAQKKTAELDPAELDPKLDRLKKKAFRRLKKRSEWPRSGTDG